MIDRPIELGYVAGIIDADGCISVFPKLKRVRVRVQMTDKDTVYKLLDLTGAGSVITQKQHGLGTKLTYVWQVSKLADVENLLRSIYPLMSKRRKGKIEEGFELRGWEL